MPVDVPNEYPAIFPDLSFVAGDGIIAAEASPDGAPPSGLDDLADATAWLYGNHLVQPLVWQPYLADDKIENTNAAPAKPASVWFVPTDPAFDTLRVSIDYTADHAIAGAFTLRLVESNQSISLDAVDAAGARRRAVVLWQGTGLGAVQADFATLEFDSKGTGAAGNAVHAVLIERVALSQVPDGLVYGYPQPNPDAYAADKPCTPDKPRDLSSAVSGMRAGRTAPVGAFSVANGEGSTPPHDDYRLPCLVRRLPEPRYTLQHAVTADTQGAVFVSSDPALSFGPYTARFDLNAGETDTTFLELSEQLQQQPPYAFCELVVLGDFTTYSVRGWL